jgi:hypothetical protein
VSILKGRGKRGILVLLMATLWLVMLTGCPPRHTEEEERQVLSSGQSKLTQALEEHYGLKEGDFQIASSDIYWQSAYGYAAVKYSIEAGDKTFMATVNLDSDEVFTDYYGKEFEEKLTAYLVEKMDGVSNLREAPIQILAVEFNQPGAEEASKGMIPAALSPEDFATYLEESEKEQSLNVTLTLAWYSEDAQGLSDNLLELLAQGTDRLPSSVTVKRFACEQKEELHPMDLKEVRYYYIDHEGAYDQYSTTYDYREVSENIVVRRSLDDYKMQDPEEVNRFTAQVDVKGHLSLYPENEYYDLYFKEIPEETKILYQKKDTKTRSKYFNVLLFQDSLFENWRYGHVKGDVIIVVGDLIQK